MHKMDQMPEVVFGNYKLRTILKKDYQDYFEFGSDEDNVKYLTWKAFKTKRDAKDHIVSFYHKRKLFGEPVGYSIIDLSLNKMIGTIDFHTFNFHERTAEIGYLLSKSYWGKGVMSSALRTMIEIGFEYLSLNKIIIRSIEENIASRHVIEACGLELKNIKHNDHYHMKTKTYHNVYEYEIERNMYYGTKTKGNI